MSAIGLPMDGHVEPHLADPSGKVPGLCWCPCEDCTLRTTRMCVCADCPCESDADHDGTGKEQVPREVLVRMGWLTA